MLKEAVIKQAIKNGARTASSEPRPQTLQLAQSVPEKLRLRMRPSPPSS